MVSFCFPIFLPTAISKILGDYKASDFYRSYTYWADANGYGQSKLSQTSFALKVKTIDGIEKNKNGTITYVMDWVKIIACLKQKNLWDEEAY